MVGCLLRSLAGSAAYKVSAAPIVLAGLIYRTTTNKLHQLSSRPTPPPPHPPHLAHGICKMVHPTPNSPISANKEQINRAAAAEKSSRHPTLPSALSSAQSLTRVKISQTRVVAIGRVVRAAAQLEGKHGGDGCRHRRHRRLRLEGVCRARGPHTHARSRPRVS